jgi:hypothetical protein
MPVRAELHYRAEHLGRVVKTGLSPLWVAITAVVALAGGSALLGVLWGVRHLAWGLVIFLAILVFVVIEGSYRVARRGDEGHAEQVAKLEQDRDAARAELGEARRELGNTRRAVITGPGEPKPPPFRLRYYTRKAPLAGGRVTLHFVGVTNPAGQPERRAHMSAEGMNPYPRKRSVFGVDPAFPHAVAPESGGTAAAGLLIGPGQEQSWFIGNTWTRGDGKISAYEFFSDTSADWELGPDERWRISYRITCDGMPDKPFSIVIAAERGEGVGRLEG